MQQIVDLLGVGSNPIGRANLEAGKHDGHVVGLPSQQSGFDSPYPLQIKRGRLQNWNWYRIVNPTRKHVGSNPTYRTKLYVIDTGYQPDSNTVLAGIETLMACQLWSERRIKSCHLRRGS